MFLYDTALGYHLFKTTPELKLNSEYFFEDAEIALNSISELRKEKLPKNLKKFLVDNKVTEIIVGDEDFKNILKDFCTVKVDLKLYREVKKDFSSKDKNLAKNISHKLAIEGLEIDINRQDVMVIQAIKVVEDLEKDINMHCMKLREWYSLHFPELDRLVDDNEKYLKTIELLQIKENFKDEEKLKELLKEKADKVLELRFISMGIEISQDDMDKILADCKSTIFMFEYRKELNEYLKNKMKIVAPNVTELAGDVVAARLLAKAGSLSELAKCPASTIQVLGAEKALFSALKSRQNTPKYGILFHAPLVSNAEIKYKGKVSRILACKIALAASYDCFKEKPDNKFGKRLFEKISKKIEKMNNVQVKTKK